MKAVRTLQEPTRGLRDYLEIEAERTSWPDFRNHDDGGAYQDLIAALTDLQHGLCGYCEIDLTARDHQVEHVIPQSDPAQGTARALDVTNLIACCKGGTDRNFAPDRLGDGDRYLNPVNRNRSCGEAKADRVNGEFVDPRLLPALPSLTRVLDDGRIEADKGACASAGVAASSLTRTIDILNLNAERLRVARERHWNAVNDEWSRHFDDDGVMAAAARMELSPDGENRLRRFFTTTKCYFAPLSEQILEEYPRTWV